MIESTDKRIDELFNPPSNWQSATWIHVFDFRHGEIVFKPENSYIYAATFWFDEGTLGLEHDLYKVIAVGRLEPERMDENYRSVLTSAEINNACYLIKSEQDGSLNWHVFSNSCRSSQQVNTMLSIDKHTIGPKPIVSVTYRHLVDIKNFTDLSLEDAAHRLLADWGLSPSDYISMIDETSTRYSEKPSELWNNLMTDW